MESQFHDQGENGHAEQFWDKHYAGQNRPWSGRGNPILAGFAESLPIARALDLGCGLGANSLWLAQQGWHVTAVDISGNALKRAAAHAASAGVSDRISFQRHNLAHTFPDGAFDLVYAMYFQSPITLPRKQVFQMATAAVAPGGLLLIVEHASVAPWSWADPDTVFPTPQEALDRLELDLEAWHVDFLGAPKRLSNGPSGQSATVTDNIIALKRPAS